LSAEATKLISGGTAKVIKRYYVRQLNDYDDGFRIIDRRKFEVGERIAYFERESKVLQEALAISNLQRQARQIEIENLKKERDQYAKELEVINSEVTRLTETLQQTRTQLSELFRTNQGLYEQIVAENQKLKEVAGPGLASLEETNSK
jgi:chromosome segregation ATPase